MQDKGEERETLFSEKVETAGRRAVSKKRWKGGKVVSYLNRWKGGGGGRARE